MSQLRQWQQQPLTTKVLISAHGDTNWKEHRLERRMTRRTTIELDPKLIKQQYQYVEKKGKKEQKKQEALPSSPVEPQVEEGKKCAVGEEEEVEFYGHMDNFGGVHATMKAYFSGKLPRNGVRIEITYGEEIDMEGAKQISRDVQRSDVVIVVGE
jgi:hypothetical protein